MLSIQFKVFFRLVYWLQNEVDLCPFVYSKSWVCFVIAVLLEPSQHSGGMALTGKP